LNLFNYALFVVSTCLVRSPDVLFDSIQSGILIISNFLVSVMSEFGSIELALLFFNISYFVSPLIVTTFIFHVKTYSHLKFLYLSFSIVSESPAKLDLRFAPTSFRTPKTISPYLWKVVQISNPWLAGETKDGKNDESGPRIFGFVGTIHVEHHVLRLAQDGEQGRTTIGGKLPLQINHLTLPLESEANMPPTTGRRNKERHKG
jgi:hypothetical protein